MSKLDEIKEILNTLRVSTSVTFGILMLLITGLIKRFDSGHIDLLFWAGVLISFLIIIVIFKLYLKISEKTKNIGAL